MALLEIRQATFKSECKLILDNLNLAVRQGEIHALIGTNGTGKSTLAHLIMGCNGYHLCSGKIVFAGKIINDLSIQERAALGISLIWQEPARFEGILVRDYLSLGNSKANLSDSLENVGLDADEYLYRLLDKTMSGGERKRIELASMLALQPRLCILDEPISGIDLLSVKSIIAVIGQIKKNGSTVLLISHREEIASIADRASLLCGGKIIQTGVPEDVVRNYKTRQCFICDGKKCGYASI